jgi:4-cresol dehydrogenase (hydroxylating)
MMIPKNVTAEQWNAALAAFKAAIGEANVYTSDEDIALYRDPYSPVWGEAEERLISAALAPKSVEEVQAIVRAANQYGVPLYPISTGKNLGYGGPAPNLSGSVVVDLKRMNKIIEVDDKRHFAIVEPGVSYFDLHRHIRDRNLKVWIDCPDPGWGSVVGNALDHGVGWTWGQYKDHFWAHCGLEVVLPNGELLRTGMGAMPGAKTSADFRYGYGPYVDGLFSQAGFGIVTRMGIHLMPEPEAFLRKVVTVPRRQDLIPLVEIANVLESSGIIGTPMFDSQLFYAQMGDPAVRQIASSPDVWNGNAADRYAAEKGMPSWQVGLNFYGPPEIIEAKWQYAKAKIGKAIPGARYEDKESLRFPLSPEAQAAVHYKGEVGIPSLSVFAVGARSPFWPGNPTDGHLFFSPIVPRDGEEFLKAQRIFAEGMRSGGVDHNAALGPFGYGPFSPPFTFSRTFVLVGIIPVSRSDPQANKRSRDAMRHLIALGAKNGYGEYRTAPAFQDQVMGTYDFNDHALRRFCETLKDAVDPKGIISPGRGGFWPRSMRKDAK